MECSQQHGPRAGERTYVHSSSFDLVHPGDVRRRDLENFIAERYRNAYGARVTQFADALVGMHGDCGGWSSAVGFTVAGARRLFVEQYLDVSVQDLVTARVGKTIEREEIVEVGNLAADSSGAARTVILCMTRILHDMGLRWVVLTATRELLNSFRRIGIPTVELAIADPARLPDGGAAWGTYYSHDPRVIAADIEAGYRHLATSGQAGRGG